MSYVVILVLQQYLWPQEGSLVHEKYLYLNLDVRNDGVIS